MEQSLLLKDTLIGNGDAIVMPKWLVSKCIRVNGVNGFWWKAWVIELLFYIVIVHSLFRLENFSDTKGIAFTSLSKINSCFQIRE